VIDSLPLIGRYFSEQISPLRLDQWLLTRGVNKFPRGREPLPPYNMESLIIKFINEYIYFYSLFKFKGA